MISVYEAEYHGPDRRHRPQKIIYIFFLPHLVKKSLSTTVVFHSVHFFLGADTFFESNLVSALWMGNIFISFVALLQP